MTWEILHVKWEMWNVTCEWWTMKCDRYTNTYEIKKVKCDMLKVNVKYNYFKCFLRNVIHKWNYSFSLDNLDSLLRYLPGMIKMNPKVLQTAHEETCCGLNISGKGKSNCLLKANKKLLSSSNSVCAASQQSLYWLHKR